MKFQNIHFLYEPNTKKQDVLDLAAEMIGAFGQAPLSKADLIISIGGDGTLLHALQKSKGAPVLGLKPPASNSHGYLIEHNISTADDLRRRLENTASIPLIPLRADITFANGRKKTIHAFNDVAFSPQSAQAVTCDLTAQLSPENGENPYATHKRIMGDGLVFSTAMGSTGTNASYNGQSAALDEIVMIMTGKGVYNPKGMPSIKVTGTASSFSMAFVSSTTKRSLRIDYDGQNVFAHKDGSPIVAMKVSLAPKKTIRLLRG